jgi:rubrerythrin
VSKEAPSLGETLPEILRGLFDFAVPDLYPNLELGARPLKGNEGEEILKAANLNGLPRVFYGPPEGLELVVKEDSKYLVNPDAPIAKKVSEYLAREHSYGKKVTGRTLEDHFSGIGYGWEREMLWLVLATLLRAGAIEVMYQGRRYRSHLDPQARAPFTATNAFRAASFAPRKAPDLQTLVAAARRYESLTGEEVDVEETTIAQAFQRLARAELEALLPVEATVHAYNIPLRDLLAEYHTTLETILNSASDDCVNMLAGEGADFQNTRDEVAAIRRATDERGLLLLRRLRAVERQMWPMLEAEGHNGSLGEKARLVSERLEDGSYYKASHELVHALEALESAYRDLYETRHRQRQEAFGTAIEDVKAQENWPLVAEEMRESVLRPLTDRAGHECDMPEGTFVCNVCSATLSEMASDLAAVGRLRTDALLRLQELTAPEETVERVRLSDVVGVGQALSTPQEVERVTELLRDHLLRLLATGVTVILE